MTKVCVLMLTYNKPEETLKCFRQVAESLNGHKMIVLDNGSDDCPFTPEITAQYKDIDFALADCNWGVAGGRNIQINIAVNSYYDILIFVDSDVTVIDPNWIERLIKPLERENVGVCGPAGSYVDWNRQHPFVPAPVGECDVVSGWCMAVKRECLALTAIRMDEQYGLFYEEDSDFCMQIRFAGWDVWNTGDVGLKHTPSNSGANLADRAQTLARFAEKWRGKMLTKGEGAYG